MSVGSPDALFTTPVVTHLGGQAGRASLCGPLVIRADAGLRTGTGHVMRCLALAQAWRREGGRVLFVAHALPTTLRRRLREERFPLFSAHHEPGSTTDAHQTALLAARLRSPWIVCDGYVFGADFQRAAQQFGAQLLIVDDYGSLDGYYGAAVLNQNPDPPDDWYARRGSRTHLLTGSDFALLRQEFLQKRNSPTASGPGRKVLVTLGGSDPDNVTSRVLAALVDMGRHDLEIRVVVGGTNPHVKQILAQADRAPLDVEILTNRSDMPDLMTWADLVVGAGGSTCWELACLGVPFVVIVLAENQRHIAETLDGGSGHVNLGWHAACTHESMRDHLANLLSNAALRQQLADAGRRRIDGLGSQRVVDFLLDKQSIIHSP